MKTLHLIEAIPASGKTRAEIAHIASSNHNRFLYVCKGLNQIDALVKDLSQADPSAIITPFKSDEISYGSITERIEKFVKSIPDTDTTKQVVVITHRAYDMLSSVTFFDDANFHMSYDEKPEFVVDLDVEYDNQNRPEHFRVIKDGKTYLSHIARNNLDTEQKLRSLAKSPIIELIGLIEHTRYDVYPVTDKLVKDNLHEFYQAYIKENYFLNNTRILSFGLLNSSFHKYINKTFTNTKITTEEINYTHRNHTITVIPMTKRANSNHIQTSAKYRAEYERMMHKMFDMAIALKGKAMSYTNKHHEFIAKEYERKGVTYHLPNYLHGLNDFRDYNVLISTFVSNRSPESVLGLTKMLDMTAEEAMTERTKESLIQVAQRGVTRDYENEGRHMTIFVVSLDEALHIKKTIPNVTIDMTQINSGEFTFEKKRELENVTPTESGIIRRIKQNHQNIVPAKARMVLKANEKLKGAKYKQALVKAGIWDKFNTNGKWIG